MDTRFSDAWKLLQELLKSYTDKELMMFCLTYLKDRKNTSKEELCIKLMENWLAGKNVSNYDAIEAMKDCHGSIANALCIVYHSNKVLAASWCFAYLSYDHINMQRFCNVARDKSWQDDNFLQCLTAFITDNVNKGNKITKELIRNFCK